MNRPDFSSLKAKVFHVASLTKSLEICILHM